MALCISYLFSSRKSVVATCDLVQACCLSLERCSEPLYLAYIYIYIYLASPWWMLASCPRLLRACISC